jgi:glycosyltransferase involved in cell wall biosynthesis
MEHGLVHVAGDSAALAEHLLLLDRDRALLARLREASIARAATLTWENATKALIESYERVLARQADAG